MRLLDSMTSWVDEVPPEPQSAQRFGNLAFRKYIAMVEQVSSVGCLSRRESDKTKYRSGYLRSWISPTYPDSSPASFYRY